MTARARSARSLTAEAAFLARLDELRATLLEPEWRGGQQKHHVRCAAGHDCWPMPTSVQRGQGICKPCANVAHARIRFTAGEASFRLRLEQLRAVLLEPEYLGSKHPHRVRCANGHECQPRPNHVLKGGGICSVCAKNDPAAAEADFRARLADLGATPLYEKWLGSQRPHRVKCANGHGCHVRPGCVQAGQGCCKTCGPRTAHAQLGHSPPKRVSRPTGRTRSDPLGAGMARKQGIAQDSLNGRP